MMDTMVRIRGGSCPRPKGSGYNSPHADLRTDPQELRDVYRDPAKAAVVTDLKRELERLRVDLKVPAEMPREAYGQPSAPARPAAKKGVTTIP